MKDNLILVPVCSRKERRKERRKKMKERRKEKRSNADGRKIHKYIKQAVCFPVLEERLHQKKTKHKSF